MLSSSVQARLQSMSMLRAAAENQCTVGVLLPTHLRHSPRRAT